MKATIIYILAPKSPAPPNLNAVSADTVIPSTDAKSRIDKLLMTVGKWTSDLHDEIYVFDNSQWRKDKKLYESVIGTKLSDVILPPSLKAALIADITTFFTSGDMSLNIHWKRGLILQGTPEMARPSASRP